MSETCCQNAAHHHDHEHEIKRLGSEKNLRHTAIAQIVFVSVQIAGAFLTGSQAIFSDALHAVSDGVAIFIAWLGEIFSHTKKTKTDEERRYLSKISALIIAVLILISATTVMVNCIHILYTGDSVLPGHIHTDKHEAEHNEHALDTHGMLIFAVIGLMYTLFFSHRLHRGHTHNEKTLSLHLLMDAGNWFITILGALIIEYTHFVRLDAILGLVYMIFVIVAVIKRLRATLVDWYEKN
jgi:cobalt-zinc-cadmium efflux system protein